MNLHSLKDKVERSKKRKRVGRGPGSRLGKTCGRGHKGAGSRSGYKRRAGYEGGQFPLYMKMPKKGFSRGRFKKSKEFACINLYLINEAFEDGETVSLETLKTKGLVGSRTKHVKLLGEGKISKQVSFHVTALSGSAKEKLQEAKLSCTLVESE